MQVQSASRQELHSPTLRRHPIGVLPASHQNTRYGLPFYLTLLYLALEYGRPQDLIPALQPLHLPAIVIVSLLVSLLQHGRLRLGEGRSKLFIAFLVLMAVHVPFAVNNYWAFHTTRGMLITFVAYIAIVTFVNSFKKFQSMVNVLIGIHIYLAISGILMGGTGIGGFLGDENDFSVALNMIIPLSFFLGLAAHTGSKRIWYFLGTGVFLFCNLLTFSRGGFVGLLAVALHGWLRAVKKVRSTIAVVVLALAFLFVAPDTYWKEMQTILPETQNREGTAEGRMYSWRAAWKMFLNNPIVGVGPGNFPWHFGRYEPRKGLKGKSLAGRAAHSLYFTLIPELGIIGTILFGYMLYASLKDLRFVRKVARRTFYTPAQTDTHHYQKIENLALALEGSVCGFLISGIFLSVLYYPLFWIWMGIVAAFKQIADDNHSAPTLREPR